MRTRWPEGPGSGRAKRDCEHRQRRAQHIPSGHGARFRASGRLLLVLLERDRELGLLADHLANSTLSGGKVVLLRGEAGVGKSSLVREFLKQASDEAHIHVGFCDDLLTPQPLGPFWDIARSEPFLAEPIRTGDRPGVWEATLDLLSRALRPTILVIEDTQWADEATFDAIKYLGRRIARTNGLLILTFRDGEVDYNHPLRRVIGDLPPENLVRMHLDPLSRQTVAAMVEGTGLDLEEILALTDGNPLFVTEVLASGVTAVPASIRDVVLARAAKLSPEARRVLDLVSVMPGEAERMLLDEMLHPAEGHLAECGRQGLLLIDADKVSFRHELTRRVIESSLSAVDGRQLNQQVLSALSGREDPSRFVHHAMRAGDVESLLQFAPEAARAAMALESHREALAHFRTVEPHLERFAEADRAAILDDWAREEFYLGNTQSLDILDRAISLYRSRGDDLPLARALTFAIRVNEVNGRPLQAEACSTEAISILASYPPSTDLASAVSEQAWLRLMRGDDEAGGLELADQAIAIAEPLGDDLTVTRALMYKGSIGHSSGHRSSLSLVEDAYRRAVLGGHRFEEAYALVILAGLAADDRDVERAADLTQRARDTAARYEIRPLEVYAQAMYAEILVWKGNWAAAEDAATEVLGEDPHAETIAWRMLGLIQARRGRSDARAMLDRMWALAEASGELQHVDPGASALAEHMWLSGGDDPDQIMRLRGVLDRSMRSGYVWPSGALAFWMWKLGLLETVPDRVSDFYRWIVEGEWQAAADFWETRGVPYEQGLALMHGDDDARVQAVEIFETLGASAAANRVRKELVDRGVRVPRGRARSTRDHAAGLTSRQAEVLELLAEGLTNTQIADRLFVSYRTVENHVAAVLMKLDVPTRGAAVESARAQGLLTPG